MAKLPSAEADIDNHYLAVLQMARNTHVAKAKAAQDAREQYLQTYASELPDMIREEEVHRRGQGR